MATARLMNARIARLEIAKPTLEEFFMAQIRQRREQIARLAEEQAAQQQKKKKRLLGGKPAVQ